MSTAVHRSPDGEHDVPVDAEPAQKAAPLPPPPPPLPLPPPRAPGLLLRAVLAHAPPRPPTADRPGCSASEVLPRLFISDIFTALDPAALRALRITHVVSVMEHVFAFPPARVPVAPVLSPAVASTVAPAPASWPDACTPPPTPTPPPLRTLHIPLPDLPSADIVSHFRTAREFIDAALRDESARVLVHCFKGISRSPTIVAAYLIATHHMSTADALSHIRATRPAVLPNRGFRRQLEQYEEVVRGEDDMIYSEK